MIEENGTNTDIATQGGGIIDPATLEGMACGRTCAVSDMVLLTDIEAELGTSENEPTDHFLEIDAVTEIHRNLG